MKQTLSVRCTDGGSPAILKKSQQAAYNFTAKPQKTEQGKERQRVLNGAIAVCMQRGRIP
jgi:hypothetical protein